MLWYLDLLFFGKQTVDVTLNSVTISPPGMCMEGVTAFSAFCLFCSIFQLTFLICST